MTIRTLGRIAWTAVAATAFLACSTNKALREPTAYPRVDDSCREPVSCEGTSTNVLAINLIHYRTQEAVNYEKAGKAEECQSAARVALAVSYGLTGALRHERPSRSRTYRTRFAGDLDRKALFRALSHDRGIAQGTYVKCGGKPRPTFTEEEKYGLWKKQSALPEEWFEKPGSQPQQDTAGGGGDVCTDQQSDCLLNCSSKACQDKCTAQFLACE